MNHHFVIVFPYNGVERGTSRWDNLERLLDCIQRFQDHQIRRPATRPILVVNDDTVAAGRYDDFSASSLAGRVDAGDPVWAVDTSQMWLDGWRRAYRKARSGDRILLLPGDTDNVDDDFWRNSLPRFFADVDAPFVLGDYGTPDTRSTKYFIDTHGTYPLLAVWFPHIARELIRRGVRKPRTEFLHIERDLLGELLVGMNRRKYAYEETLNMLVQLWDWPSGKWRIDVRTCPLGDIRDDPSSRRYMGSIDQIERTERLLKRAWREKLYGSFRSDEEFLDRYDVLTSRSASVCDNARVTILALAGVT
jgi:hypothetical protein